MLRPIQNSGRYIRYWNSYRLRVPNRSAGVNGKMTAGGNPGAHAHVTTPPSTGFSPGSAAGIDCCSMVAFPCDRTVNAQAAVASSTSAGFLSTVDSGFTRLR